MRLPSRSFAVLAVAAFALLSAAPAVANRPGPHVSDVTADCVGDLLRGEVQVRGSALQTVTLRLDVRPHGSGGFVAVEARTIVVAANQSSYPYSFVVTDHASSAALRVVAQGTNRKITTVSTASCAPGTEVPEVAIAAALPLSMLVTGYVLVRRRRRSQAVA